MSFDWPKVKLQEVTTKLGDGLHGTPVYDEQGDYHFINGNNLENGWIAVSEKTKKTSKIEYLKHKKELNDRTVLVSINGTIGNVALYRGEKVFLGKSACYFNVVDTVDKGFVFYVMVSRFFQDYINSMATGSTIKNVSLQLMRDFEFHLPPLKIQQEIASILSALDNRISLLIETNTTLEAIAKTLFKSWFVDFDPVKAKVEGRLPEGMSDATAALFPSEFEESALGLIPKGWRVQSVGDMTEITKGKSYSSKDLVESHHTALVTLKSFERGGGFRLNGFKPYSGSYKPNQVIVAGDLIVAYTDVTQAAELIGKPAIVVAVEEYQTLVASLDVGIIRPKSEWMTRQFLYGLFCTESFQAHTFAHTSGTTVLHLSKDGIGTYKFICPPMTIINNYSEIAESLAMRRQVNIDKIRTLTSLRDTLLPRLISGQLRINQAQQIMGEVGA